MTSLDRRSAAEDLLLQPENSVLVFIDYQPIQMSSIKSISYPELVANASMTLELAKAYDVPIVLSTVNVKTGRNQPTLDAFTKILGKDYPAIDRTSINAWQDKEFVEAVKATGRKNIVILALWTEACLTFPTLDALKEGYNVYPVVDAVGGTSVIAHETALRRVEQAGAHLISNAQLACEWQRDWNRTDYVPDFIDILLKHDVFPYPGA